MGLFSEETQFEKECKELLRVIRNADVSYDAQDYFSTYVMDVRDGKRNNDFYEFDFLRAIILECLNSNSEQSIEDFEEIIKQVKFLLPLGMETEDYEIIKNMIINGNHVWNMQLYALFNNRLDYIQIMKIIQSEKIFSDNYDSIVHYAITVSPYCINTSVLKSELLSFIDGLKSEYGDIEAYQNKCLTEAKKRCGVYPIDEKTLALIASEASKAQGLIAKLEAMQKQVNDYQEKINTLTENGKKEIGEYSSTKVKEMQQEVESTKSELTTKLDEYLLTLEQALKNSSDQIFNQILIDSQNELRDIKLAAQSLSGNTTTELLRIQQASEASVDALKKYVESEPQLQKLLKEAADSETVKKAILQLSEAQQNHTAQVVVPAEASGIIIPGNDRLVVPANPKVILPRGEIQEGILPAFDESIPFDTRYQKILDEKKRREDNGEIFHSMIDEVINCVMEGDWVYLWGPSGCGKSYIFKQVASLVGIDLIENGKITDKYSIMAYNDPHGRFRATQAFVALTYGKLLSLDEFDNGNPDTQVVLNELYSGLLDALEDPNKKRYITFAEDMTVPIHPNFRMISAGNTSGEGENQLFSSRGKIDEAVQERMTPKKFDYDNRVEQRIFGSYTDWYGLFANFRKACDAYAKRQGLSSAPGMITTRDAAAIVKYIRHNSKKIDQILREKFIQTKSSTYLNIICDVLTELYDLSDMEDVEISDSTKLDEISEKVLAKKLVLGCQDAIQNGNR